MFALYSPLASQIVKLHSPGLGTGMLVTGNIGQHNTAEFKLIKNAVVNGYIIVIYHIPPKVDYRFFVSSDNIDKDNYYY